MQLSQAYYCGLQLVAVLKVGSLRVDVAAGPVEKRCEFCIAHPSTLGRPRVRNMDGPALVRRSAAQGVAEAKMREGSAWF